MTLAPRPCSSTTGTYVKLGAHSWDGIDYLAGWSVQEVTPETNKKHKSDCCQLYAVFTTQELDAIELHWRVVVARARRSCHASDPIPIST
ncbi:hypothetical protein PM082_004599 [Marasmius tenuissimus]|nr:hypothetical protein PM082_004599 [Marasmius tenuissimus]